MNLTDIALALPQSHISGPREGFVTSIADDSRKVTEGGLFIAVEGSLVDGHEYIEKALTLGATVIVAEKSAPESFRGTWIKVPSSREALTTLASLQAGSPSADLDIIGITGTNGKTTIACLVHGILKSLRHRAGMIGTIQTDDGVEVVDATHTTPGALELQSLLARMRDNGCGGVAMEVSSHGLEQGRTDGLDFKVGVFTNLTQDHLDYHGSMENYYQAKRILFRNLAEQKTKGVGVINGDDRWGVEILKDYANRIKTVSYGFGSGCDFQVNGIKQTTKGMEFQLQAKGKSFLVRVPLIGRFNALNSVAALAAVNAIGVPLRDAVAALRDAQGVRGRLEFAGSIQGAAVFVDYAHTPDALRNVCQTLRELEPNRLITVFGCGGDRDRGKRAPMARAAERDSDYCIVTSDNPRSEDPEFIASEVTKGFVGKAHRSVIDRKKAIREAVALAREGDIVLIAGKGHENSQIFATETVAFDDRVEVRKAIEVVERSLPKETK